jgi:hypothetical protein
METGTKDDPANGSPSSSRPNQKENSQMNPRPRPLIAAIFLLGICPAFCSPAQTVYFDPTPYTTGKFDGCSPQGNGSDPYLNRLKNRDLPPPNYSTMRIKSVLTNLPKDFPPRKAEISGRMWTDNA